MVKEELLDEAVEKGTIYEVNGEELNISGSSYISASKKILTKEIGDSLGIDEQKALEYINEDNLELRAFALYSEFNKLRRSDNYESLTDLKNDIKVIKGGIKNSNQETKELKQDVNSLESLVKNFGVNLGSVQRRIDELPDEYKRIKQALNYLINNSNGCKYDAELAKEENETLNEVYKLLKKSLEEDEGDDVDEPEPIPEPEPEPEERTDTNFHTPYLRKNTNNKITVPLKYKDGKKVKSGTRFEDVKDFFLYDLMDNNKLKEESVKQPEFNNSKQGEDLESLLKNDSINMVVIGGSEEITTQDVKKYLLDKEGNEYKIEWLIANASVDKEDDENSEEIRAVTSLPVHTSELMNVYSHFKHVLNESQGKNASIIDVFHYIGSLITPFKTRKSNKTTDDFLGAYAVREEFHENMKSELKPPLTFSNELWKKEGVPKKETLRTRLSDVYKMFYIFNKLEDYTSTDLVDQFNNHRDEEFKIQSE